MEKTPAFNIKTGMTKKLKPPIVQLGSSLAERINSTTAESGDLVLQDLHKYFEQLNKVYSLMLSKDGSDVSKGMDVFNEIEEQGGPPHTTYEINFKLLKVKYKMNNENKTQGMKTVLNNTKDLWKKMEERANRLRNGIPDSEPEEEPAEGTESSEGELH